MTEERGRRRQDDDRCPICQGRLVERRLKKHCERCGTLCETCCDNGTP